MSFPLAGMLSNRMACGYVIMIGATLYSLGFVMTSFMSGMNWLFLSHGLLAGVGTGLGLALLWLVMPVYFQRKIYFATGILSSSASAGTIVCPVVIESLLDAVGWRNTFRVLGGSLFGIAFLVSFFVLRTTWTGTIGKGLTLDYSVFKIRVFVVWCAGSSVAYVGRYIPFFFVVSGHSSLFI